MNNFLRWFLGVSIWVAYLVCLYEFMLFNGLILLGWLGCVALYCVCAGLGALTGGIIYNVLPYKKETVAATIDGFNRNKKDRVIGYWLWIIIWIAAYIIPSISHIRQI